MRRTAYKADRSVPVVTDTAHTRLRAATRELHDRLEDRFDAVGRFSDPEQRTNLVIRYAALHVACDRALQPWIASLPELEPARRGRTPLLVSAIAELDATLPPQLPEPPVVTSQAESLGLLYVLEGATLGGRTILRSLAARGISSRGLLFLDPYGAETGAMWTKFRSVLNQSLGTDDGRIAAAVLGALRGFAFAETCLCDGAPA